MHYRWLWQFLRPHRAGLAAVVTLALLSTALGVLTPWVTKQIIDEGLLARSVPALQGWVGTMVAMAVLAAILGGINRRAYVGLSSDMLMRMRLHLFDHLGKQPPQFYQHWRQGDLISRLDGDMGEVQRFAVDSLLAAVNGVFGFVGVTVLMWILSPTLTLLAFVMLPVSVVFLKVMRPRLETQTRQFRERASDVSALLVDRLPNMLLLQSFMAVSGTRTVLDEVQQRYRQQLLRNQMLGYWVVTVPALFATLATAVVFIVGGRSVIEEVLTLGALIAFAAYLGRVSGPINTLLGVYVAAQRAGVSLARLHQLLDAHSVVPEPTVPEQLGPGKGALCFDNMGHCAPGAAQSVLWHPVSLAMPGAARVWVSGPSGAGKSTLLRLLQRHADPSCGQISIDGVALSQLSLNELRREIMLLQQEAPVLDASVRENLALGERFDSQQLSVALEQAELGAWLSTLDAGLDTRLGDRGARLSGGERHRLALARVFLRQPRVLLFDEVSSAMDAALEQAIWSTVDRLFTHCTLIVVSHRQPLLPGLDHELQLSTHHWCLRDVS